MSDFKFGQLLEREDICDREQEIKILQKITATRGRCVVYGPRRYGKTSVVKNVVMADFLASAKKSFAVYCDLFQLDSSEDLVSRLQTALELALSQKAKIKQFFQSLQNYIRNFKIELSPDPLSGTPSISLSGQHVHNEKSLPELFAVINALTHDYKTLLIFDEFQDITNVPTLEAKLRSELQSLNQTAIILLGSKQHVLSDIFNNEKRPFYGFGIDVEFSKIPLALWTPYIQKRFATHDMKIDKNSVAEICQLMRNVPNAIQEFCQWISMQIPAHTQIDILTIRECLTHLIENKASRYLEHFAQLSVKEKRILLAIAKMEPVTSSTSTDFLQASKVSATAIRAAVRRFTDSGLIDHSQIGYALTDPLFRHYLLYQF